MRFASSLLLLAVPSLFAQVVQGQPVKPASIEGTVTSSATGAPVVRAHVILASPNQNYGAITDATGRFSITGVEPGSYALRAERVGFVNMPSGTSTNLKSGDSKTEIKVVLTPTGAITGRILDSAGQPVEQAQVSLSTAAGTSNVTSTNEEGRFRIGSLAPGTYRVRAALNSSTRSGPAEIRTDGTEEIFHATTWYPNVTEESSAGKIGVQAGAETSGIEIRLVRAPILRVSGRVVNVPQGSRAQLEVSRRDSSAFQRGMPSGNVQRDGMFEIWRLDPGKYTIRAVSYPETGAITPGSTLRSAPFEFELLADHVDRIELPLIIPFNLGGQVIYEDEGARPPRPGSTAQGRPQTNSAALPVNLGRITLQSADGSTSIPAAEINEDGTFKLSGVTPDRFRINITWGSAYVKSTQIGQTSSEGSLIDLRYAAAGTPLTIVLSSAMGSVSGMVQGELSVPPTETVMIASDEPGMGGTLMGSRIVRIKPDGSFSFEALPPGKYRVGLADQALYRGGANPRDLEQFLQSSEQVEVRAREKVVKDLRKK